MGLEPCWNVVMGSAVTAALKGSNVPGYMGGALLLSIKVCYHNLRFMGKFKEMSTHAVFVTCAAGT